MARLRRLRGWLRTGFLGILSSTGMTAKTISFVICFTAAAGLCQAEDGETFFESEIRPVLASRCVACHGPEKQEGDTRLDSRAGAAATVATGLFAKTIRGRSAAPTSCVLENRLADAFDRWIALGLPWPERATVASAEDRAEIARRHWAFQPIREPAVPDSGPANPIDAFVAARLKTAGLSASPEADRRTLIRRLSYTLTGLPPSFEDVERFVADADPLAYEKLVDRLLESQHYGEHWARHWLDVARYSDTKGYVYAREEKNWPHAWVYRDWVTKALNSDLPYDRFLMLQLAADQIADKQSGDEAAMGFLTIGRRFLGVKHEIIDDRIDVVTRGMLGLTAGCARCHDHKYDPIPAADYYSLHGVFDSSVEKLVAFGEGGDEAFWKGHAEREKKMEETMAKFRVEAADRARERLADYLKAQTELHKYPADGFDQIFQKTDLLPAFVHAWRDYLRDAKERRDPVFLHWHAYADTTKENYGKVKVENAHPLVAKAFATAPASFDEVITRYAALLKSDGPEAESLRAVIRGPGSPCEIPEGPVVNVETYFDTGSINELWKLTNEIHRAINSQPKPVPVALTLADRARPAEPRILLRGNPLTLGDRVPRQFLGILAGEKRQPFAIGSGRLELARAIVDPGNPLTARVIVNRVWAHHFGAGLVDTPSDFGTRAEPPSHPELLDWLATRFVREGWSLKKLHRRLLTSATYRQSSAGPADPAARSLAVGADPDNRLLWRMHPHRLGYEEFRDSMMAASGDLDPTIGGRAVEALKPPYAKRRALYGKVDRQFVPGVLRMFDFANPDLHIPKRNETTVPQQALFFLNHPLVLDRARAVAKAAEKSGPALSDRARALFRLTLQREPGDTELADSLALIQASPADDAPATSVTAADWQYGFGAMDEKAGRVTGFTALPHFTGAAWQGGAAWPDAKLGWVQLTATGGHPGNDRAHAAVRRWTAPRAQTITIRSKLIHEPAAGDGIRAFIVSSRAGLLGSASLHAKTIELNVETLAVEAGETIDFLVDIGAGLNSDQFLWDIALSDTRPDREKPAAAVWNAQKDFPASRATPLSPWEQLAQALLCSNEFLFVD
jgi:cytochrome c553